MRDPSFPLLSPTIVLSFTSSPSPLADHLTSLCLFTCNPLFLIADFLCDWKISIILESLHKSLPSHFLAEMVFLLICTVSDHIEHSLHTALFPVSPTDTVQERGGSKFESKKVTFKICFFHVLSLSPEMCILSFDFGSKRSK